jgi:hypothetical protein
MRKLIRNPFINKRGLQEDKLMESVVKDYADGKELTYKIYVTEKEKEAIGLLNYLNYNIPVPDGYDDHEGLEGKLEGVYRFDNTSLELVNGSLEFDISSFCSDLYLDLGLKDVIWLELKGQYKFDYYSAYLKQLEEKGYTLSLKLMDGPYKIYDSIHKEMKIVDYTLRIYVTVTPLKIENK